MKVLVLASLMALSSNVYADSDSVTEFNLTNSSDVECIVGTRGNESAARIILDGTKIFASHPFDKKEREEARATCENILALAKYIGKLSVDTSKPFSTLESLRELNQSSETVTYNELDDKTISCGAPPYETREVFRLKVDGETLYSQACDDQTHLMVCRNVYQSCEELRALIQTKGTLTIDHFPDTDAFVKHAFYQQVMINK